MHTARTAKELGRDMWSIPGRITEEVSRGTNLLMREGANIFLDISDFIQTITAGHGQMAIDFDGGNEASGHEKAAPVLDDTEKAVYSLLQRMGAKTEDDIVAESGLDFVDVNMALMNLEAEGLIYSTGGRYAVG